MTLLQSMEGKYYEVPEDQAQSFEVPREKVRELLTKAGPPSSPQGAPAVGPGQRPAPGGGASGGSPVIIQVLPNGIHGAPQHSSPPPAAGGGDGDVDPYWWYYWWRNWSNYWY